MRKFKFWIRNYFIIQRITYGVYLRLLSKVYMIRSFPYPWYNVLTISKETNKGFQWELSLPGVFLFTKADFRRAIDSQ